MAPLLVCSAVLALFAQAPQAASQSKDSVWHPVFIHVDTFPKPTGSRLIVGGVNVGRVKIVLEKTLLEDVRARFGGVVGQEGDASTSLLWLCLHGEDASGAWGLWFDSGEVDGDVVGGFLWRRLDHDAKFDPRCKLVDHTRGSIQLPVILRLGSTEKEVIRILGQPSQRKGDVLIYSHERGFTERGEPWTMTNTVFVELSRGVVSAIQVDKSTQS